LQFEPTDVTSPLKLDVTSLEEKTMAKKRLTGKIAVVTGAGRGLGRVEALALAREGAKVVVNDNGSEMDGRGSDPAVASAVAEEIRSAGGEAVANTDSVATWDGAKRIIDTAVERWGGLDILINNAGNLQYGRIWEIPEEVWDLIINIHLKGTFNTVRHAAPIFCRQRSGVIINTSSMAGLGEPMASPYAAAKEGIVGFTRSIYRDLGPFGVRCNVIRPLGLSRMCNPPAPEPIEAVNELQTKYGMPGIGNTWLNFAATANQLDPEEVGALVVWLCTDAAANVTGRTFEIGSGQVGLYSEPQIERSVIRTEGWDAEALDALCERGYLTGNLHNPFQQPK